MERSDKEITVTCENWGSHGGEYRNYGFTESEATWFPYMDTSVLEEPATLKMETQGASKTVTPIT